MKYLLLFTFIICISLQNTALAKTNCKANNFLSDCEEQNINCVTPDMVNESGASCLHITAYNAYKKADFYFIKDMIEKRGFDANKVDKEGRLALQYAIPNLKYFYDEDKGKLTEEKTNKLEIIRYLASKLKTDTKLSILENLCFAINHNNWSDKEKVEIRKIIYGDKENDCKLLDIKRQ